MAEEIVIDDEVDDVCELCFMYHNDADLCCVTDIEDMPSNCPRRNDLIEV